MQSPLPMNRSPLRNPAFCILFFVLGTASSAGGARGQEKDAAAEKAGDKKRTITLAERQVELAVPKGWKLKKPANRIIDHEFAAPAVEGDKMDGRITVMGAGGSVEANISRWIGQFSQPDGKPTRERTSIKKSQVAGCQVHRVDISGSFRDRPGGGPFSGRPAVLRKEYRMLGAIIVTDKLGQYFVKFYGPRKTVAANEKAFDAMIGSIKIKKAS